MTRTLVSSLGLVGAVLAFVGIAVQRRALARFGRPDAKSRKLRPYWNCVDMFQHSDGVRLFLKGDAAVSWGLMIVLSTVGYIIGRW